MSTIPNFPVDTANMAHATRTRIAIKPSDLIKTGATTAAADVVTLAAHGFSDGDFVEFTSGTNFTGLTAGTIYVVRDAAAGTFKLATAAGGEAIAVASGATAGTFSGIIGYETAKFDDESQAPQADDVEMPDDSGVYYPVLTNYGSAKESWVFATHEILRLRKIFNGALQGVRRGRAKMWIPSAQLAQAGVTDPWLESEWFDCTVIRSANITYGDKKASVTGIRITSQKRGPVLFPEAA